MYTYREASPVCHNWECQFLWQISRVGGLTRLHSVQCNLSYPGSLGPRGARNCESARKYESSTTCVDFETFNTLNIPFSLISFKQ